ncbi:MAG: hypothetical protein ACYC2X_09250 [Coriobacteriia bacterium]
MTLKWADSVHDATANGYEHYAWPGPERYEGCAMTCYLKHLGWLFRVLELDNDAGNRHRLDRAIKEALELGPDAPCDEVDAYLAALSGEERFELIDTLERALAQ